MTATTPAQIPPTGLTPEPGASLRSPRVPTIDYDLPPVLAMPVAANAVQLATGKCWSQPGDVDARAVPPSLYSINVYDSRDGQLVGKFGLLFGDDLVRNRQGALQAAKLNASDGWDYEAMPKGPPELSELVAYEEWR